MTDSRTSATRSNVLGSGDPDSRTSATRSNVLGTGDPGSRTSVTRVNVLARYRPVALSGSGHASSDGSGVLSNAPIKLSSGHKATDGYLDLDNGGGEAVRTGQPDFLTSVDKDSSLQPTTSMTIRFDAEFGSVLTGQAIIGPAFSTGKREWSLQYGASSGDLRFQVSSGGGSWTDNMTVTPTGGLTANTRYQFKLVWSGTQLDWYEKPGVLGVDYEGVAEEWELLGTDSSFMNISSLNDEASGPMTIGARTAGGRTQSTIRIYEYILEVDGSEVERINGTIADLNTTTDTFSTDYLSWAWLSSDGDLAVTAPTAESGEAGASNGSGVLTVTSGFLSLSGAGHASSEGSGDLSVQTIVGPADLIITWYQIYEMNNGANGGEGTFDPVANPSGSDKQFTQLPPTGTGTSGPTGGTGGIVGHGTVVVTEDRPRVLRPARQIIRPGGRK